MTAQSDSLTDAVNVLIIVQRLDGGSLAASFPDETPEQERAEIRRQCNGCVHRRPVPGSAHIACDAPDVGMTGDPHGIREGWWWYPLLFDPVWSTRRCTQRTVVDSY